MTQLATPLGVFIRTPVNAAVSHPCQAPVWVAVEIGRGLAIEVMR
jgi:hypothetical protein